MALDPSISLQAGANQKSFDLGGIFKTGMDLQRGQQDLALGEQKRQSNEITLRYQDPMAQTALQTAQQLAEAKKRELGTQTMWSNAFKAKGKRNNKTGGWDIPSDDEVMGHIIENAGVDAIDPTAMYSYLQSGSQARQSNEGAKQQGIRTASDLTEHVNKRSDALDTYARSQKDPIKVAEMAHAFHQANTEDAIRALGPEGARAANLAMTQRYGDMKDIIDPVTGQPDPKKWGETMQATAATNAAAKTITPQGEVSNKLAWEANYQNAASNYTTPEWRTGTPKTSKTIAAFAKGIYDRNLAAPGSLDGMTGKAIYDLHGSAIKADILPGATRTDLAVQAADIQGTISKYDSALSGQKDVASVLSTRIGSEAENLWQKYVEQKPTIGGRVNGAITEYNRRNPGRNLSMREGWPIVEDALRQDRASLKPGQAARQTAATSPSAANPTATPAAPAAVQGSPIGMLRKGNDGKKEVMLIKIKAGSDRDQSTWRIQ